jgi:glycosyltransferase involved in cell wall biosynthesis
VYHVRDLLSGSTSYERAVRRVHPTRFVTNSNAVKRALVAYGAWAPQLVDVAHNAVDSTSLRAQADRAGWRAEMALAADDVAVGIVGRLVPWKGQDDFIRAAALLAPRFPRARFFVVGDMQVDALTARRLGDERTRLEHLVTALGIAERLTFTGRRQDVPSVMAGLDVLVLASHAEPFGNVLLEAMCQGTATVATHAGGADEIVVDGQTGRLVPPRDPSALAAGIGELLEDPARRRAFGLAGRRRVSSHFSLERQAHSVRSTWERCLHLLEDG